VQHGADNSFPSDHASVAFAVAFAVLALHRRFGLVLLLFAAAVANDRIFVGVHYPVAGTAHGSLTPEDPEREPNAYRECKRVGTRRSAGSTGSSSSRG